MAAQQTSYIVLLQWTRGSGMTTGDAVRIFPTKAAAWQWLKQKLDDATTAEYLCDAVVMTEKDGIVYQCNNTEQYVNAA